MSDRYSLRAHGFALVFVGAVAEALFLHGLQHSDAALASLGLAGRENVAHEASGAEKVLRFLGSPVMASLLMLMMLVMPMRVAMRQWLMGMHVFVPLSRENM